MLAQSHSVPQFSDYGSSGYAARVVRSGLRSRGERPRRVHPVIQAVGERFAMRDCDHLTGMRAGQQTQLGKCCINGRPVFFQFWFPFLGIAVDNAVPIGGETEVSCKRDWCAQNLIIYFGPSDATDLDLLRDVASQRRGAPCK